jgi:NAD(P)-dependent dehydrogenase (short-subunit alcohol dehydrogenase family)
MNGTPLLAGRTALVTGASRGIGRSIAQRLAAAGATVVVTARSLDESVARERFHPDRIVPGTLRETVAIIAQAGGRAVPIAADLVNAEQRDSLIARATALAGPIDILINNAGSGRLAPIADMSLDTFDFTFDQYLRAPFVLSKAVIPGMKARGAGWIVNISSVGALPPPRPFPREASTSGRTAYGAVKAALNRFTQGLAEELVGDNIAVNAVAPSTGIRTPGAAELFPPGFVTEDPAYMAEAVLAMCHLPAAERTGLVAYSMHFIHDEHLPVMSLDGTRCMPAASLPAHAHPGITSAGSGRAYA